MYSKNANKQKKPVKRSERWQINPTAVVWIGWTENSKVEIKAVNSTLRNLLNIRYTKILFSICNIIFPKW